MELTKYQKYYRGNKEKRKIASNNYYKTKRISDGKEYLPMIERVKNKKVKIPNQKIYLRVQRSDALTILGGECAICGFSDYRALQIDHINGGGSKERKERNYIGSFHSHVIRSTKNKENKYQLLCANCNWIKRYENNELKIYK